MIYKKIFIFTFTIILYFLACQENNLSYKKLEYERNGTMYSECYGEFIKDTLGRILCFNKNKDTILVEHYENETPHGFFQSFFSNLETEEIGTYEYGKRIGVWKKYYNTGSLKDYSYYVKKSDSISFIYHKEYDSTGFMNRFMLPLKLRPSSDDFYIKSNYFLEIYLDYSQYTEPGCLVFLEENISCGVKQDTLYSDNNKIEIEFSPKLKGKQFIKGMYCEFDASDPKFLSEDMACMPFKFEFIVID